MTQLDKLVQYIESLVFAAPMAVSRKEIRYTLENTFEAKIPMEEIDKALEQLKEKYQSDDSAIEVVEIADGFQFLTKPAYHHVIGTYLKQISQKRLSRVALETLAIIAYKQPVTKAELEQIRGVNCDYAVQKLLEKELIGISGRSEGAGRPLVYVTSEKFMDYFGLRNIGDLPKLKDIQTTENAIGSQESIDELAELVRSRQSGDEPIEDSTDTDAAEDASEEDATEQQLHLLN